MFKRSVVNIRGNSHALYRPLYFEPFLPFLAALTFSAGDLVFVAGDLVFAAVFFLAGAALAFLLTGDLGFLVAAAGFFLATLAAGGGDFIGVLPGEWDLARRFPPGMAWSLDLDFLALGVAPTERERRDSCNEDERCREPV